MMIAGIKVTNASIQGIITTPNTQYYAQRSAPDPDNDIIFYFKPAVFPVKIFVI